MRKEFSESLLTIASQNKLNVLKASENFKNNIIDLIIVSEMPVGENLSTLLLENRISCRYRHISSHGYPNGLWGSQDYHQELNYMDNDSISRQNREFECE